MYIKKSVGYVLTSKDKNVNKNDVVENPFKNISFIRANTEPDDIFAILHYIEIVKILNIFIRDIKKLYHCEENTNSVKAHLAKVDGQIISDRINKVSNSIKEAFFKAAATKYAYKYYKTIYIYQQYVGDDSSFNPPPEEGFARISREADKTCNTVKSNLYSAFEGLPYNATTQDISNCISLECGKMYNSIMDEIHRFEILGAMYALKEMNIEYYQVVNGDHDKACEKCKAFHRAKQKVSEAIEGENLPLIHPNCRCTIGSYADLKDLNFQEKLIQSGQGSLNFLKNIWVILRDTREYNDKYNQFLVSLLKKIQLININGKSYIRLPDFQKNVFLNDGKVIDGTDDDNRLIELMKKRHSVGLTNEEYDEAVNLMKQGDSSVDFFKPIEYYEVGRDVTNEVWEIIEKAKKKYWYLRGVGTTIILKFRDIVRNGGPLDLKNQSQFMTNSTFLFEGKIVDTDYLGNFVYGYIGRFCGIQEGTLFSGAGYAQTEAGTSNSGFASTYFDDPKDQYAILEGILKNEKNGDYKKAEENVYE